MNGVERLTISKERRFAGFRMVVTRHERGSRIAAHAHTAEHVAVLLSGGVVEFGRGVARRDGARTARIHRAGATHALYFTETSHVACFLPHEAAFEQWTDARSYRIASAPACGAALFESDDATHELFGSLHLLDGSSHPAPPGWLASVIATFPWTSATPIGEAARAARIEHTSFDHAFRRFLQVSPREFRAAARVDAAARMLAETDDALCDVALACGFADQSHFTKAFSLRLGMSPGRFRRAFAIK